MLVSTSRHKKYADSRSYQIHITRPENRSPVEYFSLGCFSIESYVPVANLSF